MIQGGVARKHRLANQNLAKNASYAPDISRFLIGLGAQEHLGGTIPPGGNFLSEYHIRALAIGNQGASQPEIADLEVAVAVE